MNNDTKLRKILITGATGFVGQHLISKLLDEEYGIHATVREYRNDISGNIKQIIVPDLLETPDWNFMVSEVETIVHLAADTHSPNNQSKEDREKLFELNVNCSLKLAEAAINSGVKRFIFLSSIKVNGETSDKPFIELDAPNPQDEYAQSKLDAEMKLRKLVLGTSMELVIIRTPLIYGFGVTGNFLKLKKLIEKKFPFPLSSIKNKRTLCSIYNLIDFIQLSIHHPSAKNEIFFVADQESLSTPELIALMGKHLGKSVILLPVFPWLLKLAAIIFKKQAIFNRLVENLEVDVKKAYDVLEWMPPNSVEAGIKKTLNCNKDEN